MKKLLFLTLLMLSVVGARAQQPSFIEFFGNYAVREGFTSVELGRRMMQMMTRQAGTDASLALSMTHEGLRLDVSCRP